jgi:hypothetical protein
MKKLFYPLLKFLMGVVGVLLLNGVIYFIVNYELVIFNIPYFISAEQSFGVLLFLYFIKLMYNIIFSNSNNVQELKDKIDTLQQINNGHAIVLAALIQSNGGKLEVPKYLVKSAALTNAHLNIMYGNDEANNLDVYFLKGEEESGKSSIN